MSRNLFQGKTTSGATVTIYWAGTTTKPTIYRSNTGASISNPITANFDGTYAFWIADGHYKILNGSVGGDLNDVRLSVTTEGRPKAEDLTILPYISNTTYLTQEDFNEAILRGDIGTGPTGATGPTGPTGPTGATGSISTTGTHGSSITRGWNFESITLSGTSTDSAGTLIPANSVILYTTARVSTTITTSTDWAVMGKGSGSYLVAPNTNLMAGSVSNSFASPGGVGPYGEFSSAGDKVSVVTTGAPGAGVVEVGIFYETLVDLTS